MKERIKLNKRIAAWAVVLLVLLLVIAQLGVRPIKGASIASAPVDAETARVGYMPDFGQHSMQWCWVGAAANCFYWLKHYGNFPGLYPDIWDEIDPDSTDMSNEDWYCPCTNGYRTLLKEICVDGDAVHEESLVFCSRFFRTRWQDYVGLYVDCLEKFIADEGYSDTIVVRTYENPTFDDYKRELDVHSCVVILYQWGESNEDIHLVTGVSYDTYPSPLYSKVEVSDPFTAGNPDHNNDPALMVYDRWNVVDDDPFEIEHAPEDYGVVRYLFSISLPTIYIRADGSVEGTDRIHRNGSVFTLTDNVRGQIVVEKNNIVIDGAGWTLEGLGGGNGIDLSSRSNVIIKNFRIVGYDTGILLSQSTGNIILDNRMTSNGWAIGLLDSFNNTLCQNDIYLCGGGIVLSSSSYNNAYSNTVDGGMDIGYVGIYGLHFQWSHNNNAYNNSIKGIYEVGGITLWYSNSNKLNGNTLELGHGFWLEYSSSNLIVQNIVNLTETEWYTFRMVIYHSPDNIFYHNNFILNQSQNLVSEGYLNVWDNGYPSGGNYWSDYLGVDADEDGIGDTPYIIDENNTDHYPLMKPWTPIPGDVNGDGAVDVFDLSELNRAYGSTPVNPNCDFNSDGKVDIHDIFTLGRNYG